MVSKFKCHKCDTDIVVQHLLPGEVARCKFCGADNVVPGDPSLTQRRREEREAGPGSLRPPKHLEEVVARSPHAPARKSGWIKVVGVLGIVFGCFGLLGSAQSTAFPRMMEFQRETLSSMEETFKAKNDSAAASMERIHGMFVIPEWYETWMMASGAIGLLINGFYIFAFAVFLQVKRNAIRYVYLALSVSMAFAILKMILISITDFFMAVPVAASFGIGLVFDLVLLIVILGNDKGDFQLHRGSQPAGPRTAA